MAVKFAISAIVEFKKAQYRNAPFALRFAAPSAQSSISVGVRPAGLEVLPAALAPHPSWVASLAPGGPGQ
jgi:hypothetical protein